MEIRQLVDQQTQPASQPRWSFIPFCLALTTVLVSACGAALADPPADASSPTSGVPRLIAESYDSGFKLAHDTYNGMGAGSDGKIYYVLCAEGHNVAGQMFALRSGHEEDRATLGDLTEACGEKDMKAVAQGKSHVNFVECQGKLYFATHTGFYAIIDDMEKMGPPPPGWKPYQGGHFLAYDMATGKFENLALRPAARESSP